jgi:predicted HAD superfamily Cof-like phosphohydrolase
MTEQRFFEDIVRFNQIYKLPSNDAPQLLGPERIKNFHAILAEEVEEGLELAAKYEKFHAEHGSELPAEVRTDVLAELSDWLGDIVVYCASEARRWGIPLPDVLKIIMESNFSKLGADGKPIYDERGKVMKGPNYWKPEPKIREIIGR